MPKPRRISLKLTPEQRAIVRKAIGKDAEALDFDVEELEERIAPGQVLGLGDE